MSLITESSLRAMFKKEVPPSITVNKCDILTPSARQYLKERGVTLTEGNEQSDTLLERPVKENHYKPFIPMEKAIQPKYVSHYDGGLFEIKPEHMTHLHGNKLVYKDDARIVFRGRLDSLQSLILETQFQVMVHQNMKLFNELDEILNFTREVLRSEVKEIPVHIEKLLGLDDAGLREHSHYPKKYYGVEHFIPDVTMGIDVVLLNKVRTEIREVELVALKTFRRDGQVDRADIIQVFNRLSSAIYIMMCRARGGYYGKS